MVQLTNYARSGNTSFSFYLDVYVIAFVTHLSFVVRVFSPRSYVGFE